MKKIISLFIAVVMVVCMSSVAFASSLSANDDIVTLVSDVINLDVSSVTLDSSVIKFLKEWLASDANVLFAKGDYFSPTLYFAIVPLDAEITVVSESPKRNVYRFTKDFRYAIVYPAGSLSQLETVKAGNGAFPSLVLPIIGCGSYFSNTSNDFNQSLKPFISTKEYTIKDGYGIFNGWKSSVVDGLKKRTVSITYKYEDGSIAAPAVKKEYAVYDSYSIPSPVIDGYVADIAVVTGDNITSSINYNVVYSKIKTREISVIYQYEDGGQAFPPFGQTFNIGDSYSILSPLLDGYIPSVSVLSGIVTDSMSPVVSFTVVYSVDRSVISSNDFIEFTDFIFKTVGVIVVIGVTFFGILLSVRYVIKVLWFWFI